MLKKSFMEYLNHKNKISAPKTEVVPDYNGPTDSKPAKEKKHKDAGGSKSGQKTPAPYKTAKAGTDPNKSANSVGFAQKGDAKLKYDPLKNNKKTGNKNINNGKEVKSWPSGTKTEAWLKKTKDMPLAEFVKEIKSSTNLKECACNGGIAFETITNAVRLAASDKTLMKSLVREMKRNDSLNKLIFEVFAHNETYKILSEMANKDKKIASKLNEMIAPPIHKGDDEDEEPLDGDGSDASMGGEDEDEMPPEEGEEGIGDDDEQEVPDDEEPDEEEEDDDMGEPDAEEEPEENEMDDDSGMDAPDLEPEEKYGHNSFGSFHKKMMGM